MINDTTLQVNLTLNDQLTASLNKSFTSIKASVDKATQGLHNLGSELVQAGRNATYLGVAITGPLALAFKTTSDYSIQAGDSLKNLSSVTVDFQRTIGTAMIPVIDKFTKILQEIDNWFKALDPHMRTVVIQSALMAGVFLVLFGAITNLIGHFLKLSSAVIQFAIANAGLLIVVGIIVALIIEWERVRDVVMPIITGLQIAVDMVAIGFYKLAASIAKVLEYWNRFLGLNTIADFFRDASTAASMSAKEIEDDMTKALGGQGWAQAADNSIKDIKQKFQSLMAFFNQDFTVSINTSMQQFGQNFQKTFKQAYDNAMNLGANSAKILIGQINQLSQGIGDALGKSIIEGKNFGESMKQVFRDMAEAFISAVIQMIAQWLAFMALKATASAFGFGFFHSGGQVMHEGGPIRAHSGLAVDEVPIIAQTGEGILSRRGMDALGGSGALNALNQGKSGGSGGVQVVINGNVSTATPDDLEELALRISRLWNERGRSRVR